MAHRVYNCFAVYLLKTKQLYTCNIFFTIYFENHKQKCCLEIFNTSSQNESLFMHMMTRRYGIGLCYLTQLCFGITWIWDSQSDCWNYRLVIERCSFCRQIAWSSGSHVIWCRHDKEWTLNQQCCFCLLLFFVVLRCFWCFWFVLLIPKWSLVKFYRALFWRETIKIFSMIVWHKNVATFN